jgi:hypothetical protein
MPNRLNRYYIVRIIGASSFYYNAAGETWHLKTQDATRWETLTPIILTTIGLALRTQKGTTLTIWNQTNHKTIADFFGQNDEPLSYAVSTKGL